MDIKTDYGVITSGVLDAIKPKSKSDESESDSAIEDTENSEDVTVEGEETSDDTVE